MNMFGLALFGLALRRDRILLPAWIAALVLLSYVSAVSTSTLYSTVAERVAAAEAINASPGIVALYGPILDVHSLGELAMTKMTVLYALGVAVLALFVVRRHTRLDEEGGQAELLGATAIGARTPLRVAVAFSASVSLAVGVLVAVANIAGGLPVPGSVAFGAAWCGVGLVGTGLAALACQLSASSRTCAGIALAALGALFLLRAIGDASGTGGLGWLSWLSPFGWNTQLRAYGDTRWWVLLLYPVLAAVLVAGAEVLRTRRDLGAGLLAPRPGPGSGSARLRGTVSLTVRLQAPTLLAWTVALTVLGLLFGAIAPTFTAFETAGVRDLLERLGGTGAFTDVLLGAVIGMLSLAVTCYGISVVTHGAGDEQRGRTDQVLATATSRTRVFAATVLVAVGGTAWLLLVSGVALAIGLALSGGGTGSAGRLVLSALAQAPAVWAVVAVSLALLALGSHRAVWGWAVVFGFAALGQFGDLLDLPDWALSVSPYAHAPKMPLADFELGPAVVLTTIALMLGSAAQLRFRVRDIG